MIDYEVLVLGELQTNCYLVWEERTKKCLIVDPADDGVGISEIIQAKQLVPVGIVATHGHFDHVMGALDLKLIYQIPFYCSSRDQFLLDRQKETAKYFLGHEIEVPNFRKIDVDLDKISKIKLGSEIIEIIKTPGHTPGGVCLYHKKQGLLWTGDTIFKTPLDPPLTGGLIAGRTDLSYSSNKDMEESVKKLPKDVVIMPGHGHC